MAASDAVEAETILADLSQFGLIHFSGEDAQTFLQAQLSCNVDSMQPWSAQYGSYNSPQGRMLASFLLWRADSGYFMQLARSLAGPIQQRLCKYILRSKVKAADVSEQYVLLGIAGAQAEARVKAVLGALPQSPLTLAVTNDAAVLRLSADRLEIAATAERAPALRDALSKSAAIVDPTRWDWLDIRAGIAFITPATQDQFVPQMANLDLIGGVSFSKGCYPGQEIVARMHYRGQLKQRMYLVNVASAQPPQAGDKLYSPTLGDQSCGMIVNGTASPSGGYDALAVIRIESAEHDEVHWKSLDGPKLTRMQLPYAS